MAAMAAGGVDFNCIVGIRCPASYIKGPMVFSRAIKTFLFGMGLFALGCSADPRPLPSEKAIQQLERNQQPPLYQLLYDIPALPAFGPAEQRVRILIWLQHMGLSEGQLTRLEELRGLAENRRQRIQDAEKETSLRWQSQEAQIYEKLDAMPESSWRNLHFFHQQNLGD